jgi:hypothetical protein
VTALSEDRDPIEKEHRSRLRRTYPLTKRRREHGLADDEGVGPGVYVPRREDIAHKLEFANWTFCVIEIDEHLVIEFLKMENEKGRSERDWAKKMEHGRFSSLKRNEWMKNCVWPCFEVQAVTSSSKKSGKGCKGERDG